MFRGFGLVALACGMIQLSRIEVASAAEPPPFPRAANLELDTPQPAEDEFIPASLGLAGIGAATAIVGGIVWAGAHGREVCGLTGCVTSTNEGAARDTGTAMVGAGGGLALAGVLGLVGTLGDPIAPGKERDNQPMATSGLVFASLSASMLGSGLTFGFASEEDKNFTRAAPMFVASGVTGILGATLLIIGADHVSPEDRERAARKRAARTKARRPSKSARARAAMERKRLRDELIASGKLPRVRSPGMIAGGSTLIGAGLTAGIGLFVAAGTYEPHGWFDFTPLGYILGGALCIGAGVGSGTALIVVGSLRPRLPKEYEKPEGSAPQVRVGAGTISASWAF